LGAHIYLDAEKIDPAGELMKLGGARVILATAPSGKSIAPLINGLGHRGQLIVVGASVDPIEVNAIQLITLTRRIQGWPSGSAVDSEDALNFCAQTGIRPMIETFPLEQANEGYERMISNTVRFRVVLAM
jgi:D-arabinose 1-dehydrogenase-like Zn-dependent alcohol dehydrogenase